MDHLPPHRPYGHEEAGGLPGHPLGDDFEPIASLPKKLPLPGVANPRAVAHRLLVDGPAPGPRMAADTARHLATHYGSLAFDIARLANDNPELAERVHPDAPEIWAQVVGPRDNEWAGDAGRCAAPADHADDPRPGHGRRPREGPGPARQEVGPGHLLREGGGSAPMESAASRVCASHAAPPS